MPTTTIEDQLATFLEANSLVQSLAGGQVYPFGSVSQGAAWPFVTYWRVMGRRVRCLRGPIGVSHATIQVGCHARNYGDSKRLADALKIALDAFGCGMLGTLYVQSMIVGEDHDYGPLDNQLQPLFGDEVSQSCVSFDVTIWFQEG